MNDFVVIKTKISTLQGVKKIEDIKVGDMVYSYKDSEIAFSKVLDVMKKQVAYSTLMKIITNKSKIVCTKDLKILLERLGWKKAPNIAVSDLIIGKDGLDLVSSIKADYGRNGSIDVYKLETESGNYFANSLLAKG